jgi:hypothetical protein
MTGRATSNRVPIFTAYLVWEVEHGQRYLHNVYARKERALTEVEKLDADGRTATAQEVPVFE